MRNQHSRLVWTVGLGLVLLMAAPGCASRSKQDDEDLARRRASSHFNLAVDHEENGRVELALRELLNAKRLDPDNARVEHALGVLYLRKDKSAEGEAHILRALEIAPNYQDARFNLSSLYLHQERYEECIAQSKILYDDATFTAPWRALTNWGWAAYKLGRIDEAREHLVYARDYNHNYWPTHLNLGILEQQQGNLEGAAKSFERVLETLPSDSAAAEANYRLAKIHVAMGRRSEAIAYLRTAVVRAPDDPWGRKSEAYLKSLR